MQDVDFKTVPYWEVIEKLKYTCTQGLFDMICTVCWLPLISNSVFMNRNMEWSYIRTIQNEMHGWLPWRGRFPHINVLKRSNIVNTETTLAKAESGQRV